MSKLKLRINTFMHYSYLLRLMIRIDIKKKYKDSILGIVWSLLNPLLQMIVLTIVFSNLFSRSIDNFPLYMISGRLIFSFFTISTTQAMTTIYNSAPLIKKVYLPKYILILSRVSSAFIISLISMLDLIIVMIATGAEFSVYLLYLPLYLILLYIFCLGVGYVLSTIATFFRDMEHLYDVVTLIIMYVSAIFYPKDIIPEAFQSLFLLNPVFHYITGIRFCVYYASAPDLSNIIYCVVAAFAALALGLGVFYKNQDKFIRHI